MLPKSRLVGGPARGRGPAEYDRTGRSGLPRPRHPDEDVQLPRFVWRERLAAISLLAARLGVDVEGHCCLPQLDAESATRRISRRQAMAELIDARTVRFDTGALAVNQGAEVRVQLRTGFCTSRRRRDSRRSTTRAGCVTRSGPWPTSWRCCWRRGCWRARSRALRSSGFARGHRVRWAPMRSKSPSRHRTFRRRWWAHWSMATRALEMRWRHW